jgi:hypothetical protein
MTTKHKVITALVLAVLVAAGVTVAVVVSYTDGARPGAAYPDIGRIESPRQSEVKLPTGTLKLQVGDPSQEYDTDHSETTRAADGAVFVPVAWDIPGLPVLSHSLPVYQFELTLVADGQRYDLQAAHEDEPPTQYTPPVITTGSVAVVVEGDGTDLRVEVGYDGLTQVLDVDSGKVDPGLAAPYYAKGGLPSLTTSTRCTALSPVDQKTYSAALDSCSLGPVQLSPYVGGFGWVARKDEMWATVPYSLHLLSITTRARDTEYSTRLRTLVVTLDGKAPTREILRHEDGGGLFVTGLDVFRTSSAPKTLGLRTEVVGDSSYNGRGTRVFRTAQTFPLR